MEIRGMGLQNVRNCRQCRSDAGLWSFVRSQEPGYCNEWRTARPVPLSPPEQLAFPGMDQAHACRPERQLLPLSSATTYAAIRYFPWLTSFVALSRSERLRTGTRPPRETPKIAGTSRLFASPSFGCPMSLFAPRCLAPPLIRLPCSFRALGSPAKKIVAGGAWIGGDSFNAKGRPFPLHGRTPRHTCPFSI